MNWISHINHKENIFWFLKLCKKNELSFSYYFVKIKNRVDQWYYYKLTNVFFHIIFEDSK